MEALRNLICRLFLRVETRKFLFLLRTLFSFVVFTALFDPLSSVRKLFSFCLVIFCIMEFAEFL